MSPARIWIVLTMMAVVEPHERLLCDPCICVHTSSGIMADCSLKGLIKIPTDLPAETIVLNLTMNSIESLLNLELYKQLEILNISLNKLSYLRSDVLKFITDLKVLDLHGNQLPLRNETFPQGIFHYQRKLKTLLLQNMSGHDMEYPELAFRDLVSLENLFVNGLTNLHFGCGFKQLRNLTSLLLGRKFGGTCLTRKLMNDTFKNVSNLKYLDLTGCYLIHIEADAFTDLKNLHTLILSHNVYLGISAFGRAAYGLQNSSLKILEINNINTIHGMGVQLKAQDVKYLNGLEVEELYCDSNRIEQIELDALDYIPKSLKKLSIQDNNLGYGLYVMFVSVFTNLLWVDVSLQHNTYAKLFDYNKVLHRNSFLINMDKQNNRERKRSVNQQILTVIPGNFTFHIPTNLIFINFSRSRLHFFIPKGHCGENTLRHLDLSHNFFGKWYGPVTGLNSLEVVDLSNNFCDYVAKDFLVHFPAIRILNISNNYLGGTLKHDIFDSSTSLEHLDLSDNKIENLPNGILKNNINLKSLNLSFNYLSSWQTNIGHLNLEWIDISRNVFEELPYKLRHELVQSMQGPFTLYMEHNQFKCDCETMPSLQWMMNNNKAIPNMKHMTCKTTDNKQLSLSNLQGILTNLNKECFSYIGVMIGLLSIVLLLVSMAVSGVLFRYRWKLRYLYFLTRFKYRRNQALVEEDENQWEYDAFISYADEDRRLVVQDMRHRLEEGMGFRLCIHHRDFLPGEAIAANILNAVKSSRKTVVILSGNFLKSYWCRYEVEMARMEHIYTGRNVLLIVVLEDIPVKDLPSDIISVMQQDSYVEYTDNREEQEAFWQSLNQALRE